MASEQKVRLLLVFCAVQKSGCLFKSSRLYGPCQRSGLSEAVDYGFQFTSEMRIQVALGAFIFLCLSFLLLRCYLPKPCWGQGSAGGRSTNWPAVPSLSFAWARECWLWWKLVFVSVQSCLPVIQAERGSRPELVEVSSLTTNFDPSPKC